MLYNASDDDMQKLYETYDLRTIIDLRNGAEKYEHPDPIYRDIAHIDLAVQDNENFGVAQNEEAVRKLKEFFAANDKKYEKNPADAGRHMEEFYVELLDDYSLKAYAKFLKIVLEADAGILWHCSLGKDRCGIATLLVLSILDVDLKDIFDDYIYTNECLYGDNQIPYSVQGYMHYAHRSYLESYIAEAEKRFSGLDGLLEEMDIGKKEKESFKNKYLVD